MEAILAKISWAILVTAGAFLVWAVKGLVKLVFDNREQIKAGYFKDIAQDKELTTINSKLDNHESRIGIVESNVSTLATSHNASSCDKVVKVVLKA